MTENSPNMIADILGVFGMSTGPAISVRGKRIKTAIWIIHKYLSAPCLRSLAVCTKTLPITEMSCQVDVVLADGTDGILIKAKFYIQEGACLNSHYIP